MKKDELNCLQKNLILLQNVTMLFISEKLETYTMHLQKIEWPYFPHPVN